MRSGSVLSVPVKAIFVYLYFIKPNGKSHTTLCLIIKLPSLVNIILSSPLENTGNIDIGLQLVKLFVSPRVWRTVTLAFCICDLNVLVYCSIKDVHKHSK